MAISIRVEAKSVLEGYVSAHPQQDAEMTDGAKWREAAAVELKCRQLGVVKAFSDDLLQAIANGEIDMAAVYAAARKKQGIDRQAA
jgi:hypothetical protein